MNIKGVEDGISDEPRWVKQRRLSECDCWKYSQQVCDICQGVGGADKAAVPSAPTFSYQLAMYLARNGADAPHMQAEINMFLYDGKWKTTQKSEGN